MFNFSLKKKNYDTWDEAFRGLAPVMRQESVRVAEYTQALYIAAVRSGYCADSKKWQDRMQFTFGELAFKCGLYHQLGKAYLPVELQVLRNDFTKNELEEYKKYTTDGAELVEHLQRKTERTSRLWGRNNDPDRLKENIPLTMIMESCSMHMEKADGTGFPEGLKEDEISPIGYIVGISKEFDRLVTKTKSENPFDEAFGAITANTAAYPAELIAVLKKLKDNFKEIYLKYIQYSQTIPATVPLVNKREDRPMGLAYRAMINPHTKRPVLYMADSWFGQEVLKTEIDKPGNTINALFKRTGIIGDVCKYMLYEACDTVLRMENCRLDVGGVVYNIFPEFYSLVNQMELFQQLFEDQPIDSNHLMLTVAENVVINSPKSTQENIKRYIRNGVNIILTDYHPDRFPLEKIQEFGFRYVSPAKEMYGRPALAKSIAVLHRNGLDVIATDVDNEEMAEWMKENDVLCFIDSSTGISVNEDTLIRDCLLIENEMV